MSYKKKLLKNLFFLFLGHLAGGLLLFAAMAYAARVLGPGGFGIISFAEVVFMFFLSLGNLGLSFFGTREVARYPQKIHFYVDRILSARFFLNAASFFILAVSLVFLKLAFTTKMTVLIYGAALIPASLFLDWLFQGMEKMHLMACAIFARALIFALGVFGLLRYSSQVTMIGYIFVVSWVASSGLLYYFYSKQFGVPKLTIDPVVQKKLFKESLPIGITLLVGWIIQYFDTALLFSLKGKEAAGQYNVAYRPVILIVAALAVFFNAIFPAMARASGNQDGSMKKIVNVTLKGGLALLLPMAVLGTFFALPFIRAVYGAEFVASAPVFGILIWWPLLVFATSVYARILICYDKQKQVGKVAVIGAGFNIGFNAFLVPLFSGLGASVAKLTADLLTLGIYHRLVHKDRIIEK